MNDEVLVRVLQCYVDGIVPEPADERTAVKATLAELTQRAPGRSVEVRIPPYAAVQVVAGSVHRRGTPSAVVEANARTWLELAVGRRTFADALHDGSVRASGERSDLSEFLPLVTVTDSFDDH